MSDENQSTSQRSPQQDQTYVVLVAEARDETGILADQHTAWVEIATVTVPPRTKRSVVIKRALAEAGISPDGDAPKVRALDVDSAHVYEPEAHQPAPEWRI
jgi:lipoprotein-anchoring transpeptidase ErfK/SrfK